MKRDMDKIRSMMLYIEENLVAGKELDAYTMPFFDREDDDDYMVFSEHIKILIENNFIEALVIKSRGFTLYHINRITTEGHDFLDALRDSTVWKKVKNELSKVGGFTIGLSVELGKDYLKKELGL